MVKPLAGTIDKYLSGRGSPMAGFGQQFVRAGTRHGVDPRLLVGIATIESGAGANEKIQYNPFNWGIHRGQSYESYSEAINDVARGLSKNYIAAGLRTPEQIVSKYAPASDNNDEGNWASVVRQVMGQLGGGGGTSGSPSARPTVTPVTPQRPSQVPTFQPGQFKKALQSRLMQGRLRGSELGDLIMGSYAVSPASGTPESPPRPGAGGDAPPLPVPNGKFLQLPTKWKSTHPTSGLEDRGYTHAVDIMGSPGTKVGAPVGGTIMRHGSAQGGSSIYFKGNDGRNYWIGHIDNALPVGTKVKRGQVIALISADHAAPHVHLDYA